jgi:hypothetical protein
VSDFHNDDKWQRLERDGKLVPAIYRTYAFEGRYILVDKGRFATLLQRRYAVDTLAQGSGGHIVAIEEKIVRWPGRIYTAFTLETKSCTKPGHESNGWMIYGQADQLLYCFNQSNGDLDCYYIDFQILKSWFWTIESHLPIFIMHNTINRTAGRVVPIQMVVANVPTDRFYIGQRDGQWRVLQTQSWFRHPFRIEKE